MGKRIGLVKMTGVPGSGKTSIAHVIRVLTNGVWINSDVIKDDPKYKYFIIYGEDISGKSDKEIEEDLKKWSPEKIQERGKTTEDLDKEITSWDEDTSTEKKYGKTAQERKYFCIRRAIEPHILKGVETIFSDATHRKISDVSAYHPLETKYGLESIIVRTVCDFQESFNRMVTRDEKAREGKPEIKSEANWTTREKLLSTFEQYDADLIIKTNNMLDAHIEIFRSDPFFPRIKVSQYRTPKQIEQELIEMFRGYIHNEQSLKSMIDATEVFYSHWNFNWGRTKRLNKSFLESIPRLSF